jgi:hypothetical protein
MTEISKKAAWEDGYEMEAEYDFSDGIPNPFAELASQPAREESEMRDEYDFSNAVKNPYVQRFQKLNLVSLDPDVKAAFPDSQSVNEALRVLMKMTDRMQDPKKERSNPHET